jgi:hypothetical protein
MAFLRCLLLLTIFPVLAISQTVLTSNQTISSSVPQYGSTFFQVTVTGNSSLTVTLTQTSGGSNDVFLYLRFGSLPTVSSYGWKNTNLDPSVSVYLDPCDTTVGTFYIGVFTNGQNPSDQFSITATTGMPFHRIY